MLFSNSGLISATSVSGLVGVGIWFFRYGGTTEYERGLGLGRTSWARKKVGVWGGGIQLSVSVEDGGTGTIASPSSVRITLKYCSWQYL
jgi:hypothetical protein